MAANLNASRVPILNLGPITRGVCVTMCGIIGCVSRREPVVELLLRGLKRLEYRGYDSAGIAVEYPSGIRITREVGKIRRLEDAVGASPQDGTTGVGHTRWATHGKPSEANAHPHVSADGRVVVAHNGIIENYRDLRRGLESRGIVFCSETDSEVIPNLIASHDRGDFPAAVRAALAELHGSFAIAVMHHDHPGVVIGARKDSPLIVGIASDRMLLASDAAAMLEATREMVFLEDGDMAVLTAESASFSRFDGTKVLRPSVTISWDLARAEKSGFEHYMLKEIHEQPQVVSDALLGAIGSGHEVNLEQIGLSDEVLRSLDRMCIVACGTSWHAGLVTKFWLERFARISSEVDYASEFRYRDPVMDSRTGLIAISQSGETADTLAALRRAKTDFNARTLGICNVQGATIARECDGLIMTHAGPEIGVASTKAFTGQLVAGFLLSLKLAAARGTLSPHEVRRLTDQLRRVPQWIARALESADAVRDVAASVADARGFLFLGRGANYPVALEGALKLKEISYMHAEGYPAGEMKHGPIALIDEGLPVVVIATRGPVYDKVASNVEEVRARGGRVIAIVNPGDDRVSKQASAIITVPETDPLLSPMINVVPLQLLAYEVARIRGCDVDQPRNLAKSVTVE